MATVDDLYSELSELNRALYTVTEAIEEERRDTKEFREGLLEAVRAIRDGVESIDSRSQALREAIEGVHGAIETLRVIPDFDDDAL